MQAHEGSFLHAERLDGPMAAEPRNLRLGKVTMHGEDIRFEPEASSFDLKPGERASLIVLYDYREASHDRDTGRVAVAAHLGDQDLGEAERRFQDNPLVGDDARGYISIPVTAPASGSHKGRFRFEARYLRSAWEAEEGEEWILAREGEFELRVADRARRL